MSRLRDLPGGAARAVRDYVVEPRAPSAADVEAGPRPSADSGGPAGPRLEAGAAPPVVLAAGIGGAGGTASLAAAVGVASAAQDGRRAALLVDLDPPQRPRGPTVLASDPARALEEWARGLGEGFAPAAARGHLCHLPLAARGESDDRLERAAEVLARRPPACAALVHLPAALWTLWLDEVGARSGLIRAELPGDRPLAALAVRELHARGLRAKVAGRPLGRVASRRALAGVEPGGAASRRAARLAGALVRERAGQSLPLVLGGATAVIFTALALVAIGGAVTAKGRVQRAADLAALSGARSMRDDFERLFAPARRSDGSPNPAHMSRGEYLRRARSAARDAAARNDVPSAGLVVRFPDAESFAPLRVRAAVRARVDPDALPRPRSARDAGRRPRVPLEASAVAEASAPSDWSGMPATASGGGYSGPLAYRQGKPMRPDVAEAFDDMSAAARRSGISLLVSSAFRSDAEQAKLFARNPDPRWVARPGQSLHRCATELDLGPPGAYAWLARNARRFGFVQRYSWEAWHYGFVRGPAPCSRGSSSTRAADGGGAAGAGLPSFVPPRFRAPVQRAAARWNVAAGLIAAQLLAESNFNPAAVSPAGAQGIAQFMPGTADSYGLDDPFDAGAAIGAQAHLMSDLLRRFGSVPLALAAYNAGPGAVEACDCVPPYPETRAYVARILGLLDGAGELSAPSLEVRLVA